MSATGRRARLTLVWLAACSPAMDAAPVRIELPTASASAAPLPNVPAPPDSPPPPPPVGPRAGDEVEVEWHGKWWPARVLEVLPGPPPRWRIHYEGYGSEWDEEVDATRLRTSNDPGG